MYVFLYFISLGLIITDADTDPPSDPSEQPIDPTSDPSEQPIDPTSDQQTDPTHPNTAPAVPAVPAVMPTTSEAQSSDQARSHLFKPTVDAEANKALRKNKSQEKRQVKRGALVKKFRTDAEIEAHRTRSTTSNDAFARRMEKEGEELQKGMAAAGQLPPLPLDSWDLEEEDEKGGESCDSINTADMMNNSTDEEEE
jgi:hypothetical protein